jgi:hypothetical protein
VQILSVAIARGAVRLAPEPLVEEALHDEQVRDLPLTVTGHVRSTETLSKSRVRQSCRSPIESSARGLPRLRYGHADAGEAVARLLNRLVAPGLLRPWRRVAKNCFSRSFIKRFQRKLTPLQPAAEICQHVKLCTDRGLRAYPCAESCAAKLWTCEASGPLQDCQSGAVVAPWQVSVIVSSP